MALTLPYAAWVRLQLATVPEEKLPEARKAFYSNRGRIDNWDRYKQHCKENKIDYDAPPEGYWEAKEKPWHKPAGYGMAALSIFTWFLLQIIGGSTGMGKQK